MGREETIEDSLLTWQRANNEFLSAALHWLRLRVRLRQPKPHLMESLAPAGEVRKASGWFRSPGSRAQAETATNLLPPRRPDSSLAEEVEEARRRMEQSARITPLPALLLLAQKFGLSDYEQNILLMCAAVELDPDMAGEYSRLLNGQAYPTFALARLLFDQPSWDALSPERSLRYFRLIEINQPAAQPLTTSPLRADERVVSYIKGLNYLDDRLAPLLLPLDAPVHMEDSLSETQSQVADTIRLYVEQARQDATRLVLVQLAGPDGLSKQLVAAQAARGLDPALHVLRLPADWLPGQAADLETLSRLWERERSLLRLGLFLDARDIPDGNNADGQAPPLLRFLGRIGGVVFLDTREVRPELDQSILALDIDKPTPYEQSNAWHAALATPDPAWPARLAGQFSLNLPTIRQITGLAAAEMNEDNDEMAPEVDEVNGSPAGDHPPMNSPVDALSQRAWQICLMRTRPHLDQLAQRIDAKAGWDDLELPVETKNLLEEICGQVEQRLRVYDQWGLRAVMNRGLGISALFAGESGTGKTMAAEVMARRLNLNLYRIDLSAVVSKYIGETEKNLRRLFDAAEDGGAILFFDEADALFGKRSEVKDSHDRYANIEINYLLQRMEAYRGLAILATNMKSALDQAFTRRLRFIVNFPFPGVEWRKRIWSGAFSPGVPLDVLDFDRLARFNLTGGSIHNAAINAIFLAAAHPGPVVTMETVLQAVRSELRKMEKPVSDSDFALKYGEADRMAMWKRAFAPDAPWKMALPGGGPEFLADGLDYARLACHDLGPTAIYDIAALSGQAAAALTPPVLTTAAVLEHICTMLRAQGKPVREEDCQP